MAERRPLAIVTGASTGIGYELARCCAQNGFDLVIAANERQINEASRELQKLGGNVEAVEADLATLNGVDTLYAAAKRMTGRSTRYWPMPVEDWAGPFSIRTSAM